MANSLRIRRSPTPSGRPMGLTRSSLTLRQMPGLDARLLLGQESALRRLEVDDPRDTLL